MKHTMMNLTGCISLSLLIACTACTSGCGGGTPPAGPGTGKSKTKKAPEGKGSGSEEEEAPAPAPGKAGEYRTAEVKDGGTLKGAVIWTGDIPTSELTYDYTASKDDAEVCAGGGMTEGGKRKNFRLQLGDRGGDKKGVRDVVVWISATEGAEFKPAAEVTLDNKNCEFHPGVMLLGPKTKLLIKNSDTTTHNTKVKYMPWGGDEDERKNANLKGGTSDTYAEGFDGAGRIMFVCDQHYWMGAYAIVQDHPYYAVTDEKGNFSIDTAIKPGKYTVTFWHSGYKLRRDNDGKMKGWDVAPKPWTKADVEIKAGSNDLGEVDYAK